MRGARLWWFTAGAVLSLSTVWWWNGLTLLGLTVMGVAGALEFRERLRD